MYTLSYFIIFTVRQYLDKLLKLNGLGRAGYCLRRSSGGGGRFVCGLFVFSFFLTVCFPVSYFLLGTSASLSCQLDVVPSAIWLTETS